MALRHSIQYNSSNSISKVFGVTAATQKAANKNEQGNLGTNAKLGNREQEPKIIEKDISAYNYTQSIKQKTENPRPKRPTIIPHKVLSEKEKNELLNDTVAHNAQLIAERKRQIEREKQDKLKMRVSLQEHVSLLNVSENNKKAYNTKQLYYEIKEQIDDKKSKKHSEMELQSQMNKKLIENEKIVKLNEEKQNQINRTNELQQKKKYYTELTVQTSRPKQEDTTIETGLKLESYKKLKL